MSMRSVSFLRKNAYSVMKVSIHPSTIILTRCFSRHHNCSSLSERDELKNRILQQIIDDPEFLRDIIKAVRHDGHNHPKIIESSNILVDYFLQADSNKDGVVTKDELRIWLERDSQPAETVRYVPEVVGSHDSTIAAPTATQLRQHMIKIGVPFIGFGFLDNVIMIISGNEIESYFGLSLGISAMAAAGLGNTLSDIVGIQAGGTIEAMSDKLGIKDPELTKEQLKSRFIRFWTILASMLGITIGCLLGMFPLLFMSTDKDHAVRLIFDSVDTDKSGKLELKELDILFDLLSKAKYIDNSQQARDFMRQCGYSELDALSFEEFKSLFNAYLQKIAVNKHAKEKRATR